MKLSTPERLEHIEQARNTVLQARSGALSAHVPSWINQSWRRCLDMGLQPEQSVAFDTVTRQQMQRVQEASQPLIQAAHAVMTELARTISDIRYFAILTNAEGIVVDVHGPVDRQDRRADAIARVGVDLSERSVGTTAISAALHELHPVWLHRGEHFFQDTSVYSCAGAPVFSPDGLCAGMLDLTGIETQERPALRHLVQRSARSIENSWLLATDHALVLRLGWPGNPLGGDSDGLITLDHDGQLVGANPAARQMLSLEHPHTGRRHASDVFALPWESLFDAAAHPAVPQEVPLWSGLRLQIQAIRTVGHTAPSTRPMAAKPLKAVQTDMIRQAVQQARGNVAEAARALGISRATVYRKLGRPH
jgi:sigma-54 dependent transcriptional regulator, acetoin dehydrogenase operon transcriptional activator AcoR